MLFPRALQEICLVFLATVTRVVTRGGALRDHPNNSCEGNCNRELMSRRMQLLYFPVTAFSWTDLFVDRISLE